MGGELGANSLEGEGSTFYCELPLKLDEPQSLRRRTVIAWRRVGAGQRWQADCPLRGFGVVPALGNERQRVRFARAWRSRLDIATEAGSPFQMVIVDG